MRPDHVVLLPARRRDALEDARLDTTAALSQRVAAVRRETMATRAHARSLQEQARLARERAALTCRRVRLAAADEVVQPRG